MSTMLMERTSACGAMRNSAPPYAESGFRDFMIYSSTTGSKEPTRLLRPDMERTSSGIHLSPTSSSEITQKSLGELRRLSGLTWEQLATLFKVSRRSLHSWASGKPLSSSNEEQLNGLLGALRYINRGSASLNRSLLMKPDANGKTLFELLVECKYDEFKKTVGFGDVPQRPKLGSLSRDTHVSRMPQNPVDLLEALQEPVHREVGQSRPARVARSQRNSGS